MGNLQYMQIKNSVLSYAMVEGILQSREYDASMILIQDNSSSKVCDEKSSDFRLFLETNFWEYLEMVISSSQQ